MSEAYGLTYGDIEARSTAAVPMGGERRCGVYFLLRGHKIVYVGQSRNLFLRVASHQFTDGKDFDSFAFIDVPMPDLLDVEKFYIRKFRPEYNDDRMTKGPPVIHPMDKEPNQIPKAEAFGDRILITEQEAAKAIGLTPRALQEWRRRGGGPQFVRVSSRCVRYRPDDIKAWAENKLRRSTSDMGAT